MASTLEAILNDFLRNAKIVATLCNQWGDSGKGKIAEMISAFWAQVNARGTGAHNAGHTVYVNGKEIIMHLLPVGILHDKYGKITILGNGMAIDPRALCGEMKELEKAGGTFDNLKISKHANVIMEYHVVRDGGDTSQKDGGIGTTGRGVGPCYADAAARRGIKINDLLDKDLLARKIKKAAEFYPEQKIDIDKIIAELQPYIEKIKPYVRDTTTEMHRFVREGKRIQLEGAQGLLLSVEHGTYPYVTSSDCSLNGTANGVGLSAKLVDISLGLVKYPFMTRVGAGPFPTELGGKLSEQYCAADLEHDIFYEVKEFLGMNIDLARIRLLQKEKTAQAREALADYKKQAYNYIKSHREDVIKLINSSGSVAQGVGIRLAAFEFGATTGRPRRTGWTDAVAAKYAVGINGPLFVLTKPDSIFGCDEFSINYGYSINDKLFDTFDKDCSFLKMAQPVLKSYPGYDSIADVKDYAELRRIAPSLTQSIADFEKFTGGRVVMISNGAEREQTIIRGLD
jgi:adenylosuccinate synthase